MIVAVGSARGPKVDAVRRALARLGSLNDAFARAEVVAREVGAAAPAMPLTVEELLEGSRSRAFLVREILATEGIRPDLAVGLEGGLEVRHEAGPSRRAFLMAWAYVTDGDRGAHGCGGALPLPDRLLAEVVDQGIELATAVDAFAGEEDIRSRQGAWGILTRGLLERSGTFEIALLNAMAPFYNPEHYR